MAPTLTRINLDSDSDNDEVEIEDGPFTPPLAKDFPKCTPEVLAKGLEVWLEEFKQALSLPDQYGEHHDHLTDGFQLLSLLAHRLDVAKGTVIEHITPMMKDMYYRGWQPKIHTKPLIAAYKRWRKSKPVENWAAPANAGTRGSTRAPRTTVARAGEWLTFLYVAEGAVERTPKGKGKANEVAKKGGKKGSSDGSAPAVTTKLAASAGGGGNTSTATVPKTPGRGKKVEKSSVMVEDSEDEDDLRPVNESPCTRCAEVSAVCKIQDPVPSKKAGGKPIIIHVCGPCGKAKAKCSLVPPPAGVRKSARKVSEEVVSEGEAAGGGEGPSKAPRAPRARKKSATTPVPAGGPGELGMSLPHR